MNELASACARLDKLKNLVKNEVFLYNTEYLDMLPDKYRLKHMKDFEILYKEGRFVPGTLVAIKVWQIVPDMYPRRKYTVEDLKIGFVVSTKVSKSAVKRNRAKRQMREVVRLLLKEDKIRPGFVVTFMGKEGMLEAEYAEIEKAVVEVLRRAKLFV